MSDITGTPLQKVGVRVPRTPVSYAYKQRAGQKGASALTSALEYIY